MFPARGVGAANPRAAGPGIPPRRAPSERRCRVGQVTSRGSCLSPKDQRLASAAGAMDREAAAGPFARTDPLCSTRYPASQRPSKRGAPTGFVLLSPLAEGADRLARGWR